MKKLLLITCLMTFIIGAQAQERYNVYMDSIGQVHTATLRTPQVAISGYFENLLHIPTTLSGYGITNAVSTSRTLTINGTSQDLSADRSWTITSAVAPINTLSKSANYTIVSGDFAAGKAASLILTVDATSGNNTQTMPSAATFAGYTIYVNKSDATANVITLSGVSGNNTLSTINQSRTLISNGTSWINN